MIRELTAADIITALTAAIVGGCLLGWALAHILAMFIKWRPPRDSR